MKHISLITLVLAFSVNSFAKDIFCASKDESILLLVSSQEQAIAGMHHADSIQIQMAADKGLIRKTNDVAGGINVNTGKAFFVANTSIPQEFAAKKEVDGTIQLNINSYSEADGALLQGKLKITGRAFGISFDEGSHDMNCVTKFN